MGLNRVEGGTQGGGEDECRIGDLRGEKGIKLCES